MQPASTEERDEESELGGTMRLGAQAVTLAEGRWRRRATAARDRRAPPASLRGQQQLSRAAVEAGLRFSGLSVDDLVEMVELPDHPFFLASQFHPEFTSNPRDGHPLFKSFIAAVRQHAEGELPEAAEA